MMGYNHTTPRKPKICDWCGKEIKATWPAFQQGSRFYHCSCAHKRENHFKRLLTNFINCERVA